MDGGIVTLAELSGRCEGARNDVLLTIARENGWPPGRAGRAYVWAGEVAAKIEARYFERHRVELVAGWSDKPDRPGYRDDRTLRRRRPRAQPAA